MFNYLCGDVNPKQYGGKWFNHDDDEDYAHVIEIIPHEYYGIESDKKYTGILSCVCLDDDDIKRAYSYMDIRGWNKDHKKLTVKQKIMVLSDYMGGDHILSLTGNNYSLILKTLKDAIYSEPYTKISPTLDAKWF